MKRWVLPLGLVALLGCGGAPGAWVGMWRGDRNLTASPGQDPSVARTLSVVEVTIRSDGDCRVVDAGLALQGRARFEDGKARVKIEKLMERPPPAMDPIRMALDGSKLRYEGPLDGLRSPVILTKVQPR